MTDVSVSDEIQFVSQEGVNNWRLAVALVRKRAGHNGWIDGKDTSTTPTTVVRIRGQFSDGSIEIHLSS